MSKHEKAARPRYAPPNPNGAFAQALTKAGVLSEDGTVTPVIRKKKPNRRPLTERQKQERKALAERLAAASSSNPQ